MATDICTEASHHKNIYIYWRNNDNLYNQYELNNTEKLSFLV